MCHEHSFQVSDCCNFSIVSSKLAAVPTKPSLRGRAALVSSGDSRAPEAGIHRFDRIGRSRPKAVVCINIEQKFLDIVKHRMVVRSVSIINSAEAA